jgi:general secretion pathway protein I
MVIWILNKGWRETWNQKAFTLLEVMVALAILAIAMTTLFGAQSQSLSMATEAKFNTNASLLAGLKLAELSSGKVQAGETEGDFGEDFPGYVWKMEVQDAAADWPEWSRLLGGRLRRVDITVSWGGDPHRYTIRYYFRIEDGL